MMEALRSLERHGQVAMTKHRDVPRLVALLGTVSSRQTDGEPGCPPAAPVLRKGSTINQEMPTPIQGPGDTPASECPWPSVCSPQGAQALLPGSPRARPSSQH